MENLQTLIENYLEYCRTQKCLDEKTLKAYRIDLRQFSEEPSLEKITEITPNNLEDYIARLHQQYKPKTVKRKIASIKAFFHYLEYKELLAINPFTKIQVHFREPTILPKIIPLHTVEKFLTMIYTQRDNAKTNYQRRNALRDAAVSELLFATGMRISELCSLKNEDINLHDGSILIYGKGDKERRIHSSRLSFLSACSHPELYRFLLFLYAPLFPSPGIYLPSSQDIHPRCTAG